MRVTIAKAVRAYDKRSAFEQTPPDTRAHRKEVEAAAAAGKKALQRVGQMQLLRREFPHLSQDEAFEVLDNV